ncbi:MAG: citrate lyase holo-[acyl-carrier protein] synthase [Synergistales bacterium]|nr:citrate lyase holo-[acyl-carrier protein] synthase [Synergistales bacterium]
MIPGVRGILRGREQRASMQRHLLRRWPWLVQIALNIPGSPKRLEGDLLCLERTGAAVGRRIFSPAGLSLRITMVDPAGPVAYLCGEDGDPRKRKRIAVELEEGLPWGRVLDIDLVTEEGTLHRQELGYPARRCFVCGEEAKACARLHRHTSTALRQCAAGLVKRACSDPRAGGYLW